jgi:iron complex transport system substrate-binding protein
MMRAKRPRPPRIRQACALAAALGTAVACFTGCAGSNAQTDLQGLQTVTITDMLGRHVTMPKKIRRILALHPIPTTLLELLAPRQIVSVDTVFARSLKPDDARFTAEQLSSLKSRPRTGVYFKGFDPEQLIRLHPDVVLTMTGDTNIDREQKTTGIPFFAVSKVPVASYRSTIHLIGQIVGQTERADRMAAFWAHQVAAVEARTASVPASRRPTVIYTGRNGDILGIPGKETVFGSTIAAAGGSYLGGMLPAGHADAENNPVSMEQIVTWDPDVVIVACTRAKDKIVHDPRWRTIKAVRNGRIYVPPQQGGLDGLQAVLGMAWAQAVLLDHDSPTARAALADVTQSYYRLFFGHSLTSTQIDQLAS